MSSLWPRNKPMSQPPHFGRLAARDEAKRDDAQTAAKGVHLAAQFERAHKTRKFGMRATVSA